MGDQQRSKGERLMMEAEAKMNRGGGGACCGGAGRARVEEACAIYCQAANAFKVAKEWHKAGNAFAEAATLEQANDRKLEAGQHFMEASKCYKKVSQSECEQCLVKAAELYDEMGRGKTSAKHHLSLAELFEEQGNLKKAVDEFQKAADMFSELELASSKTKCLVGLATHSATLGDHEKAGDIFVELGTDALNNKLLKYTANEHFARAGLCHLAKDPEDGTGLLKKLDEWSYVNPSFESSRECLFLTKLAQAATKGDVEELNEAVRSHESISRLSEWDNNLLKTIRRQIGPDLR